MSMADAERVAVEEPASAVMAASMELEVAPFQASDDMPLALDLADTTSGATFELESAANNLLSAAAAADEARPVAFVSPDSDLAETEELVASLQQFSVDEAEPGSDLVLEAATADDEGALVDLAAFDAAPTPEFSFEHSAGTDPEPAPFESGVDTLALSEADDIGAIASPAALEDIPAIEDIAAIDDQQEERAGAPLTDVAEIAPEPAFVPDLAFALDRADAEPGAEDLSGVPDVQAAQAPEPVLTLTDSEPAFIPDLSGMALDGHGFDALEAGQAMAIEAPAPDVLADADLAESAESAFVPDLSAVALEGVAAEPTSVAFEAMNAAATEVAAYASSSSTVVDISRSRAVVKGLERFLRQVEARKLQLAQGSVA